MTTKNKTPVRVSEIDAVKLLKILNEKTMMLTSAVIPATFSVEQMAERNVAVGQLFMVEEIKAVVNELIEEATSDKILDDEDM